MKKKFFIGLAIIFTFAAFTAAYAQEQTAQKTVAVVVPFDSSGVLQEEVDVVYRMFLSEFVQTGKYTVVDRSSFDKIRAQQNFQLSDWSNNDKVAKIGKALNASVVVTGQVMRFRKQVMFVTQILDVNTTEIISSADKQVNDVAVLLGSFGEMCKTLTKNLASSKNASGNYEIGDLGPGGGYVFYYSEEGFAVYDSENASPRICHYLECSPIKLLEVTWCPCRGNNYCNVNTRYGIGDGMINTKCILSAVHYNASALTALNCAAKACSVYTTETTEAGEWYLPSKEELNLIYENLVKTGIINDEAWHWSSLQSGKFNASYAWGQRFSDGHQGYNGKYFNLCVRAVRAF